MRTICRWRATEGPLMDSPVRPYVWPSNRYTRTRSLSPSRGTGTTTGGGWIHKQLVSRAFNLAPPIRRGRRSPSRLYPAAILISYPGKNIGCSFSWIFSGRTCRSATARERGCAASPEIRVNVQRDRRSRNLDM